MSRYGGMVARVCLTAAVCSAVSMPVAGQCVVYVDVDAPDPGENPAGATWKTAFATLEEGLQKVRDDAVYPCQIKVANGTYKPTARRVSSKAITAFFEMINYVEILGGFRGCEGGDDEDRAYNVFFHGAPGRMALDSSGVAMSVSFYPDTRIDVSGS